MVRFKALIFLVMLAVSAVGCGDGPGAAAQKVRLPALPGDLPLPEAGSLRTVLDRGPRGLNLVFETEEALPAAAGRLRARMEAQGWDLLSDITLERAFFGSYRKGERAVAVGVSRSGSLLLISVSYVPRPFNEWEEDQG
jgi:hypothetical protein